MLWLEFCTCNRTSPSSTSLCSCPGSPTFDPECPTILGSKFSGCGRSCRRERKGNTHCENRSPFYWWMDPVGCHTETFRVEGTSTAIYLLFKIECFSGLPEIQAFLAIQDHLGNYNPGHTHLRNIPWRIKQEREVKWVSPFYLMLFSPPPAFSWQVEQ